MKITKEQQSVLAIVAGIIVLAWIRNNYYWLIFAAIFLLTLPFTLLHNPIHKYWILISNLLGWISRHVILFFLFYFFLTPISLLMKLFKGNPMFIRLKDEKTSFFERNHLYTKDDFKNPW